MKSTPDPPLEDFQLSEDEKENHLENIKEITTEEHDEQVCPNQNSNNNNNSKIEPEKSKQSVIENIALDIITTMKFKVLKKILFHDFNRHFQPPADDPPRKISSESSESSESGISTDHDAKSQNSEPVKSSKLSKLAERQDSGLSSTQEEEDIIIIRRSRRRSRIEKQSLALIK